MPRQKIGLASVLLTLAMVMAVPTSQASGQTVTGAISGTVVDAQGAVVPGATVTVIDESTGNPRVAVSDARGHLQGPILQAGRYTGRVEVLIFRLYERKNVVLSSSERVAIGTITL